MDYIKATEEKLKAYKYLEESLDTMAEEIERLLKINAPREISAMKLDCSGVRGSMKQFDALDIACAVADIKRARIETQKEIQRINKNLDFISRDDGCEKYGQLLKLFYIGKKTNKGNGKVEYEKLTGDQIADQLNYGRQYIYKIKHDAICKFARLYWGARVS